MGRDGGGGRGIAASSLLEECRLQTSAEGAYYFYMRRTFILLLPAVIVLRLASKRRVSATSRRLGEAALNNSHFACVQPVLGAKKNEMGETRKEGELHSSQGEREEEIRLL